MAACPALTTKRSAMQSTPYGNHHPIQLRGRRGVRGLGALTSLGVLFLALASPGQAQEAGARIWASGGCSGCHGNLAEGGDGGDAPAGPSLRATRLDRDQIAEFIACGRPDTEMPFHVRGAYTEVSCYGLPLGEVPAEVGGAGVLTLEEVETLADFLVQHVVGQRTITRDNCALFYGGNRNSPLCLRYR
jgi:hypothetical protein